MRLAAALLAALPSLALAQSDLPRAVEHHMAHGPSVAEPHGPAIDDMPRMARTDIETSQPVFIVQNDTPAPADVPPPPGIDDEGMAPPADNAAPAGDTVTLKDAVPDAGEKVLPGERAADADAPLPEKVRPRDEAPPSVTIRQDENVTIEEYRREGVIYMVRVTPKAGIAYEYIDTDGDGRLEGDPREGPMQPVYYTVYEWQ